MLKRLFDLLASITGLLLLSPLFAVVSVFIKLDSRGPVFYRGVRSGRYGRPFRMFKFRTMTIESRSLQEGTTGLNDPRITRVGHLLRKFKIDELPQLIDVVRGKMSLVGPRPELPRYTSQYNEEEKAILSVRPGITDFSSIHFSALDQVVGDTNVDGNYEEQVLPVKNQLRLKYVRERNFLLDLKLLAETFRTVFRKIFA